MDRAKRVGQSVDKKKSKTSAPAAPAAPAAPTPAVAPAAAAAPAPAPERVEAPAVRDVTDLLPAHLLSPEELYRRERARRGAPAASTALAEARQAYLDLLKAEAASGKGGRPRSKPAVAAKPASDDDVDLGSTAEHEVVLEAHDDVHEDVHDDVEHEDVHADAHEEEHDEPPKPARRARPAPKKKPAPPAKRGRKPAAKKAPARKPAKRR